jgi:hypothetical protein
MSAKRKGSALGVGHILNKIGDLLLTWSFIWFPGLVFALTVRPAERNGVALVPTIYATVVALGLSLVTRLLRLENRVSEDRLPNI